MELIGFIGIGTTGAIVTSYVVYKKIEQGRKIKKHTILNDNNVNIELEDSTTIIVSFNLFIIIKASWQKKWSIKKIWINTYLIQNLTLDIHCKTLIQFNILQKMIKNYY